MTRSFAVDVERLTAQGDEVPHAAEVKLVPSSAGDDPAWMGDACAGAAALASAGIAEAAVVCAEEEGEKEEDTAEAVGDEEA